MLCIDVLKFRNQTALHQASANHKDGTVNKLVDNLRVGHNVYGWAVDEHVVVFLAETLNQFAKAVVFEQLCRVGRDCTHGQITQCGILVTMDDKALNVLFLTGKVVGNTFLR